MDNMAKRKDSNLHIVVIASLITFILAVILYRKYLSGDVAYAYSTSDGFAQFLPIYKDYLHTLQENKGLSFWNFSIGFGAVQSYTKLFYPTQLIPILIGYYLGEHAMMIAIAWMHVLKMTLASGLMTLFLKKFNLNNLTCCHMGIIYAFCGNLIVRGHWWTLGDECYIAILILLAAECYYREKKWHYIPLAVAMLAAGFGVYYLYLYGLELLIYATFRYFYDRRPLRGYFKFILCCGSLYLLGAVLMSVMLFDHANVLLNTARYTDTKTYVDTLTQFEIADIKVVLSAILSLFDVNCTGVFHLYTGALNYLERPMFYCGLSCLFLIPQSFLLGERRKKWFMAGGLSIAGLYMLFPIVTDVFNMFVKNEELQMRSYRMSSLWITILMIVISAYGLECIIRNGKSHKAGIVITALILGGIFGAAVYKAPVYGMTIDYNVCRWVVLFLILWMFYFILVRWQCEKRWIKTSGIALLICLSVMEMGHSTRTTVNVSAAYANQYYSHMLEDDLGYYGNVSDAVKYLKENDASFYRVSGIRTQLAPYCSPLYFGIYDSSYYTNINDKTYEFLNEVYPESFINNIGSKYSIGVGEDLNLSALTGYKYFLKADGSEVNIPFGYEKIKDVGNIEVYKNKYALSLGITYDKYMRRSVFEQFTDEEQRKLLLYCIVFNDDTESELTEVSFREGKQCLSKAEDEFYLSCINDRLKDSFQIEQWKEDYIVGAINPAKQQTIVFSIPNVSGWKVYVDDKEQKLIDANVGFMAVELTEGEHVVKLTYQPPMFKVSCLLSTIAILVYIILIIIDSKNGTKKRLFRFEE